MAKSSYNVKDLYKDINTINGYFREDRVFGTATVLRSGGPIHNYCHYGNGPRKDNCRDYFQMASSGVIHLLKTLNDKHRLEYDKLAEYAIFWLGYKLAVKPTEKMTDLNKFYTSYIVNNKCYNDKLKGNDDLTYKVIIDKKKDFINIKEISKFNILFNILFILYNGIKNNKVDCAKYSNYPKIFANNFEELNKDSKNIEDSSYNKMLSTLSDDYIHLKNKYGNNTPCEFPSLPQLGTKKSYAQTSVKISGKGSGKDSGQISLESSVQHTALIPEVTSSSSSITSKLIPALSTFSVIPVFLGIAYKYSLFGVDKLFQRQYLRKKLKKVKKKLKLNI
ncbi:CIR protein PIR protein [Plasmodium vinckei brucechwatti]|uniref:CIR protein PIR protein n=1 Tax=Plasmodium vinckei brucechwatti TaxID=119398 RepID=A0A6V7SGD3_PLAVN|nr:CIR protein PIR protein [Plasmodium vinckei brucechwatti]